MRASAAAVAAFLTVLTWPVHAGTASPVAKALELLAGMKDRIEKESKEATVLFRQESSLCEKRSTELKYSIKAARKEVDELRAVIVKESGIVKGLELKVRKLTEGTAENEDELEKAVALRKKENDAFKVTDKDLAETVDAITRASGIIEEELHKKHDSPAFTQLQGAADLTSALKALVQAQSVSHADGERLTALIQQSDKQEQESEDLAFAFKERSEQPPEQPAYTSKSRGLLEALEDLRTEAQSELETARTEERESLHNFQLKAKALKDEIKFAKSDLSEAQSKLGDSRQRKTVAEGDLATTKKDMEEDRKSEKELEKTCVAKAEDFRKEEKDREEEKKAIEKAIEVINEKAGKLAFVSTSETETYVSFVQVAAAATMSSHRHVAEKAIHRVKSLALQQDNPILAQLATRMESALRHRSSSGADPFEKVKGMITGMIDKLQKEAIADADKKAYCDREMNTAKGKQEKKSNAIKRLNSKVEQGAAKSAKLKTEIAQLQKELTAIAEMQGELDKIRKEEADAFKKQVPELKGAVEGLNLAIKVLREFYGGKEDGKERSSGAVAMLEVAQSDVAKNIADLETAEQRSKEEYNKMTRENKVAKTAKDADVKYKSKESAELDQAVTEASSDLTTTQEELDAINEYLKDVEKQCVVQPESFEERNARRKAEISGLKEAMTILEGSGPGEETPPALLQVSSKALRGIVKPHEPTM
eukprot:TRINITY_DN80057_c0_g1_i1.p1 TRINITY_DN80057_c0_g1~~TRINITY_DN80057_c0_g1_i1.p1  ORF type:complete len:709 (+),score=238.47 TRINITY_DN80057_c0_g1_i1:60-2186(+)